MRVDQTRQVAETQQQEAKPSESGQKGYAGGQHRGTTYRHAPRAQTPTRRNTGPPPRPRPRPPTNAPNGHHEDEHAMPPPDDPRQQVAGGAGGVRPSGPAAQRGGQASADPDGAQERGGLSGTPQSRRPPPTETVHEGAALRRSRLPGAAQLLSSPLPGGMPSKQLFDAFAAVYFGSTEARTSTRLAAVAAVARHLAPDATPPTMADIKAAAIAWTTAAGLPPSATEAQRNANCLFPLAALRALQPRPTAEAQALADARSEQLQRAALPRPPTEETPR